ncbi:lasso peptide [Brasilonema sp. UFV-L1]|uniref:lasso peptide n=1 Tax=Brasilonema sp. UFV-L1 TaxID=2234130 RepID=UPI00145F02B9|nr:lasso peptide [Brasilonema sp. UFV-L1]NMG05974.1 putative RiPP precursor [Brasilonema sp. UFV-L1]
MKATYSTPKLTVHGNVAKITQVLGGDSRKDFAFFNGGVVSDNNDLGSRDINCKNPDCS